MAPREGQREQYPLPLPARQRADLAPEQPVDAGRGDQVVQWPRLREAAPDQGSTSPTRASVGKSP